MSYVYHIIRKLWFLTRRRIT